MSETELHQPHRAYPAALRAAENQAIAERRQQTGVAPDAPLVGVALSGGGIRSATFCLGLFQALARQGLVRRIDFLSTVSGGGYFGSFLGAAVARPQASIDAIERELADNHSWSLNWLRENGRFLSPNGAEDNWLAVAVALRNWCALHVVLLTFGLLLLGLGSLVRVILITSEFTAPYWRMLEEALWNFPVLTIWWSPWVLLPLLTLACWLIPLGTVYWVTQFTGLMGVGRRCVGVFRRSVRDWTDHEFANRAQTLLTRSFMVGLMLTVGMFLFATIDSLGQSVYLRWSTAGFGFPGIWAIGTTVGVALYGFGSKIFVMLEGLLGLRRLRITFDVVALVLALLWLLLIIVGLSVVVCGVAWNWGLVWNGSEFLLMHGLRELAIVLLIAFALSWGFSRAFGFVNLSSLQQVYAARIRRAYIGASNPHRRVHENHSMTDLIPGDDLPMEAYRPHRHGGPLHLINVTLNETISGKTQVQRRDRKGTAMAIGPCGLSVGRRSHALWADDRTCRRSVLHALWEERTRCIVPIEPEEGTTLDFHALRRPAARPTSRDTGSQERERDPHFVEALSLGRWIAISGAAFTTGIGAGTKVGLSLLLGLGNVRLGYWWDAGFNPSPGRNGTPPTWLDRFSRAVGRLLPVQTSLVSECFARFHGPTRRHWYLSDGGHFENTACYELIRRRVPFIVCADCGQDAHYQFADFANLVRKARTDFGAEIEIVRRRSDAAKDDPGTRFPLPRLEDLVHPALLDVIGTPEDFPALSEELATDPPANPPVRFAKRHALLARVRYVDTDQFSWLLVIKPSLMGDEAIDVLQYQRTHPLFPQEPTSDQYFDEAQWESYRRLGEHIGTELFTPPPGRDDGWTPSQFCPPSTEAME